MGGPGSGGQGRGRGKLNKEALYYDRLANDPLTTAHNWHYQYWRLKNGWGYSPGDTFHEGPTPRKNPHFTRYTLEMGIPIVTTRPPGGANAGYTYTRYVLGRRATSKANRPTNKLWLDKVKAEFPLVLISEVIYDYTTNHELPQKARLSWNIQFDAVAEELAPGAPPPYKGKVKVLKRPPPLDLPPTPPPLDLPPTPPPKGCPFYTDDEDELEDELEDDWCYDSSDNVYRRR